ncbi:hypothetical protein O71_18231 [Pontibacter sp. BAB1700]|nr:hypothetical protein O71_18231 [Pontibacter sp. BAB1700]
MPASGKLYFTDRGYLKVVDAATRHVEQQRSIMYLQADSEKQDVISQDGKILYSIIGNAVHRLHPLTLQTLASYELNDLLPEELYHFSMLDGVSNNNRLILRARNAEYYEDTMDHAYVIDMEQQKVVTAIEAHLSYSYSMISPDGKIISAADQVYVEQSNGSWKKLSLTKQEANTLTFHRPVRCSSPPKGQPFPFTPRRMARSSQPLKQKESCTCPIRILLQATSMAAILTRSLFTTAVRDS